MKKEKSFTLIELLVVIATIALLTSIVLVALKGGREKAQIAKTLQWSRSVEAQLGGDIVGSWNFNEGSGTTALDATGYNNGTLYSGAAVCSDPPTAGCPTWTDGVQGLTGKALYFDGVDDYVDAGNGASLNIKSAITVEAWINPNSIITPFGIQDIFNQLSDANNLGEVRLAVINTGQFQAMRRITQGNYTVKVIDANAYAQLGIWQHILLVFDGTAYKLYVNAISVPVIESVLIYGTSNTPGTLIGGYFPFNGAIDEVRIYNRALTAMEIQKHYVEGAERHKDLAIK